MVLDLSVCPAFAVLDGMIKASSDICHQSPNHAVLVVFPVLYAGQSYTHLLTLRRRIEDRMLACHLDIEEVYGAAHVPEAHGNNRRRLSLALRVAVSSRVGMTSCWKSSDCCQTSKLEGIPLVRTKDMKTMPMDVGAGESRQLSPAERACQKGGPACVHIVKALCAGTRIDPARSKLIVVDMHLQQLGDWAEAAWEMQKQWTTCSDSLFTGYIGFTQDIGHCNVVVAHYENHLVHEWYFKLPESGPEEPVQDIDNMVEKPALTLATWRGSSPVLPEVVLSKFREEDHYFTEWKELCGGFAANVTKHTVQLTGSSQPLPDNVRMTSPDFSVLPAAVNLNRPITVETVTSEEFKHADMCLPAFAWVTSAQNCALT